LAFFALAGAATAAAGMEPVLGGFEMAAPGPGRVLTGGGIWLATFCVALGGCCDPLGPVTWGPVPSSVAPMFGSALRPGGGGGFDAGGADGDAARIDPDVGGLDGSGGGAEMRPPDVGGDDGIRSLLPDADDAAGRADADGAVGCDDGEGDGAPCAGPGIPIRVFLVSAGGGITGAVAASCALADDPGGGGGAAAVRGVLFFPRPSKMSRSEPLLLSSDIRVS
jgi:hypothetical protein